MNAYYRLYIKSIFKLAATLVIKSEATAVSMNKWLVERNIAVDRDDPYSWKYYLNLSGRYHPSQKMMKVISLDTLEEIDFTQENLLIHRATRREYTYGTRQYSDLVNRYPNQLMLIDGIIRPVDIEVAMSATDHNILSYDTSLVEPAEQQLIPELQKYIDRYYQRWDNADYGLFEPYYYPGLESILDPYLALAIINIRKAACLTDQAHSYHIRQYLSSFSAIGAEFDYMSQKQRLFFYRNIRYLNRNIGRQETFELLTQKVLTDRGFGLAGYRIGHDYKDLEETLVPYVQVDRETLNGIPPAQGSDHKTVGEVLDLELPLARDNVLVRDKTETHTNLAMQHSLFNGLNTKVLESNVVDRSDSEPFTLAEVLLNHWIYLAHYKRYTAIVTFTNPANGDVYKLSAENAFIFYLYAYNKAIGIELNQVPVIGAKRVRRIPLPTKRELMKSSTRKRIPEYVIDYLIRTQVDIGSYISIESFREMCAQVQKVMLSHRDMRHYMADYKAEGEMHTIVDRFYQDIRIDLAGSISYDEWLEKNNIDTTSMGVIEYGMIAEEILKVATGADINAGMRVRDIHAAMIRIMGELSSYSVQYIAQINDSPIKVVDGKFPKLSIPKVRTDALTEVELPMPTILDIRAKEQVRGVIDVPPPSLDVSVSAQRSRQKIPVDLSIKLISSGTTPQAIENKLPIVTLKLPPVIDLSKFTQSTVVGYKSIPITDIYDYVSDTSLSGYSDLTEARRKTLLKL